MKKILKILLPSKLELVAVLFLAILLLVIGNSKQLLAQYGLDSSSTILHQSTGHVVTTGLGKIDAFGVTSQVVTFVIWALIGTLCFSAVQAIASALHNLRLQRELSSNRYVHPSGFNKVSFWRHFWIGFVITLGLWIIMASVLYLFLAYLLPLGLAYGRSFLVGFIWANSLQGLAGLALLYVGILLLSEVAKLLINHRRLTSSLLKN